MNKKSRKKEDSSAALSAVQHLGQRQRAEIPQKTSRQK